MRDPVVLARNRDESGLTLVEVLVATAVLAIAIVVALMIYDQSRKSFKRGENVTEQQQAVRIAFDRINADLRMAGYNFNPDGDADTPDEQIEAAFAGAVVVRGDFDRAEEPALAGGAQSAVSVGNDEIVMYALGKPGWNLGQNLSFQADVKDAPRDGVVDNVTVPNVALLQPPANAPYTLYRITLNPDTTTYNGASFVQRTPLVENIRSLTFRYYDQNNAEIDPTTLGGSDAAANKAARHRIRRINVSLIGLTRDPDLGWVDSTDTNASTQAYRKFELTGDITPRNLGMKGIRDLNSDFIPPTQPGAPTLVSGHCQGLLVSWPPNPPDDGVVGYKVYYGTASGAYTDTRSAGGTSTYVGSLTDGTTYYVAVTALDAAGNESYKSSERSATTSNTTTPSAPGTLVASDNLTGVVDLAWGATTSNTSALTGDPASPMIRDLAGYRVYRNTSPNFSLNAGGTVVRADETTLKPSQNPTFVDGNVVNCRQYYYKVTAVDLCAVESAPTPSNPAEAGRSVSTTKPRAPLNVQAFIAGAGSVTITWAAVTQDVDDPPHQVYIDRYKIYRTALCVIGDSVCASSFTFLQETSLGALTATDATASGIDTLHTYFYKVSAIDDCPNESELSEASQAQCGFLGDVTFVNPTQGQPVAGVVPTRIRIDNAGTDTYGPATFTFLHTATNVSTTLVDAAPDLSSGVPVFEVEWLASPSGQYAITASVQNQTGCSKSSVIMVNAAPTVACCLSTNYGQTSKVADCVNRTGNSCNELTYNLYNNGCLTSVRLDGMTVEWSSALNTTARLSAVQIPDGTTVWSPGNAPSGSSVTFSAGQQPDLAVTNNYANPIRLRYEYTQAMSRLNGNKNEPLRTTFQFTLLDDAGLPTGITGVCGPEGEFTMAITDPK